MYLATILSNPINLLKNSIEQIKKTKSIATLKKMVIIFFIKPVYPQTIKWANGVFTIRVGVVFSYSLFAVF